MEVDVKVFLVSMGIGVAIIVASVFLGGCGNRRAPLNTSHVDVAAAGGDEAEMRRLAREECETSDRWVYVGGNCVDLEGK